MIDITHLDNTLSRYGHFCLVDWLLEQNLVPYSAYESWRRGQHKYLDKACTVATEQLRELIRATEEQAQRLQLSGEPQEFYQWGGAGQKPLVISADSQVHRALTRRWQRPEDVPQMDLFMDNTSAIAENQLCADLSELRFAQAQQTLSHLTSVDASHPLLGAYQDLVNYGAHMAAQAQIDPQALAPELQGLRQEVEPLAREVLGGKARDFLASAWRRLADNLENQSFDPTQPELHKSFALEQIHDWSGQLMLLQAEPALFQHPALMARLAEAYVHLQKQGLSLLLWGLLCERFTEQGERLIKAQAGVCAELWQSFLDFDEDWEGELFLGFLCIQQPVLVRLFEQLPKQPGGESVNAVNQTAIALVRARLDEQDERQQRAELKACCPAMLQCYMNKRDWYRSAGSIGKL